MSEVVVSQPSQPPVAEAASLLNIIAAAAENPNVDVVKLQALLDMQERVQARQAEASFNHALARISADMPRVKKNGTIELGETKDGKKRGAIPFARWEDVDAVIRPLMRQEGFTLSFNAAPRTAEGGGAVVSGTLLHRDGHSRTVSIPLALDGGPGRNNLQAMGSTLSYGKRYCAEMLLNIVREGVDDDGGSGDGGGDFISADEAAGIRRELSGMRISADSFAQRMGVGSIEGIPAGRMREALTMIAARRGAIKKQEGGQ